MLRFLPDGWLEGVLRPFLLADPVAGLYLEPAAPDWRFAFLCIFLLIAVAARKGRLPLTQPQTGMLLSLLVMFYVWTFAIGNGRYFIAGLALVGPLCIVIWRCLPGTRAMRLTMLAGGVALQAYTVHLNYNPNIWGLVEWRDSAASALQASPLREQPAVFLTVTGISYSILVPRFHPQSRWANMSGQRNITPALPEYPRLRALLQSPLPQYVVAPLNPKYLSAQLQPEGPMLEFLQRTLADQQLALSGQPCTLLKSTLTAGARGKMTDAVPQQGFWFCPVRQQEAVAREGAKATAQTQRLTEVFAAVERRCPRFFPPGGGTQIDADGIVTRHYPAADTRIYIDEAGQVRFKYFRSMNTTRLGTVDDVLQGRFAITCDKLPGRYQPPWQRE